jgi:hypothetical protein
MRGEEESYDGARQVKAGKVTTAGSE